MGYDEVIHLKKSGGGGGTRGGTRGSITGTLSDQTDLQTALNGKQNTITTGTTAQYFRGDFSLATFPTLGTWSVLNYPTWISGTPFVKMTASGTFVLDTNTYSTDIHSNITALNLVSGTNTGDNAINSLYSGLATSKQDTLVSGTNIKTINGSTILGSGNIVISGGGAGSDTTAWHWNGDTIGAKKTIGSIDNFDIGLITNNIERLTILNTGNVGIGTTAPAAKLDVNGAIVVNGMIANQGILGIKQSSDTNIGGLTLYNSSSLGSARWWIDSEAVLRMDNRLGGDRPISFNGSGTGNIGIGLTAPTARLHIAAGTATAGTAPLKLTSGVLNTTAEAGAIEFLTDAYYATITTGAARKTFAFLESPVFTGNLSLNAMALGTQTIATAGTTTTFTVASPVYTVFTGNQGQTLVLPNATTLKVGQRYMIDNDSTQEVIVQTNGGAELWRVAAGTDVYITCLTIGTTEGTWEVDYSGTRVATGKKLTISNTMTLAGTDYSIYTMPTATGTIPSISSTNTFTNKTITKRVASTTDSATATINCDNYDEYYLTAVANNTTISITGTPTAGQTIFIGLKDAGTSKTLTWTSITGLGQTLPTTTTISKQHIIGLKYINSAWRAIAVGVEA